MAKIGVVGAGSWGIALAKLLHKNGHQVCVWSIMEVYLNALFFPKASLLPLP